MPAVYSGLTHVLVRADVVGAVRAAPGALRAVAELHLGVAQIGHAARSAAMRDFAFVTRGLDALDPLPAHAAHAQPDVVAEEEEEVHHAGADEGAVFPA